MANRARIPWYATSIAAAAMMSEPVRDAASTRVGLCASCRFVDVITSSKESTFYRCRLSETDPSFRRYPVLPVLVCRGYQPVERHA
jgi:hypothetical protein